MEDIGKAELPGMPSLAVVANSLPILGPSEEFYDQLRVAEHFVGEKSRISFERVQNAQSGESLANLGPLGGEIGQIAASAPPGVHMGPIVGEIAQVAIMFTP